MYNQIDELLGKYQFEKWPLVKLRIELQSAVEHIINEKIQKALVMQITDNDIFPQYHKCVEELTRWKYRTVKRAIKTKESCETCRELAKELEIYLNPIALA